MNIERLETLAAFLDTLPPERLDMSEWTSDDFDPASCGTAACAVGWACTIPEFNAAGLHLERDGGTRPEFDDRMGWPAVEAFFELSEYDEYEAEHLFFRLAYPDQSRIAPRDVAARIRALIADRHVPDA